MGVDTSLEVSWCSADGPTSRVGWSAPYTDGLAFIVGLSTIPAKSGIVVVYFLSLWSFAFPQWPLVSISFAVVGTADVCH
jgi:hypothetical protein